MSQTQSHSVKIGMLLFSSLTQLDFTSAYEVFSHLPSTQIYRLAPTLDPVYSDSGFPLIPDTSFENTPNLDVLFIPGGLGVTAKLEDFQLLRFLKKQGECVRYVTSIGSGALLLAAAGLLHGYRATSDWYSLELLQLLGVEAVSDPIVVDRSRITASSAIDGITFGLTVAAELFGSAIAQETQLRLDCNSALLTDSLESVPSDVLAKLEAEQQSLLKARQQVIRRSALVIEKSDIAIRFEL